MLYVGDNTGQLLSLDTRQGKALVDAIKSAHDKCVVLQYYSILQYIILAASLWETGAEMEAEISEEDEVPAVAAALEAAQIVM